MCYAVNMDWRGIRDELKAGKSGKHRKVNRKTQRERSFNKSTIKQWLGKKFPEGICKICGRYKPLDIDHDHLSSRLRAMLCRACNLGLGMFQDNPDLLTRASEYLKYFKNKDMF